MINSGNISSVSCRTLVMGVSPAKISSLIALKRIWPVFVVFKNSLQLGYHLFYAVVVRICDLIIAISDKERKIGVI